MNGIANLEKDSQFSSPATDPTQGGVLLMTRNEQRARDKAWTESTGLLLSVLMEQAAQAITYFVLDLIMSRDAAADLRTGISPDLCPLDSQRISAPKQILFLVGAGQNGGDAWASARQLLPYGHDVMVADLSGGRDLPPEAAANKLAFESLQGKIISASDLGQLAVAPDFIIDAIFGTGFQNRPLSRDLASSFKLINKMAAKAQAVIAIDIPSGVDCDTGAAITEAIQADYTVSFGRPKVGLYSAPGCKLAGKVITAPISMPEYWQEQKLTKVYERSRVLHIAITDEWLQIRKIERRQDDHKGSFGRGLILGGSSGMAGAVILAARAMMEAGSGYTYVRSSPDILPLVANSLPSALSAEINPDTDPLELLRQIDAVAIGPGSGKSSWLQLLPSLLYEAPQIVVDADALNYLSALKSWSELTQKRVESGLPPAVLTPHPGEFVRLAPELAERLSSDRAGAALALARKSGCVVVLKGFATVTALPTGICFYNTSGNNGLGKAGSGDVLTGLICSLLAQGYPPEVAAPAGVYLHGLASDLAYSALGTTRSITPELLLTYLSDSFRRVGW